MGRECLLVSCVRMEVSIVFSSSSFSSMFCNLDIVVFNPSGKTIICQMDEDGEKLGWVCRCVCETVELVSYVYATV